ncbi:MAG TPA: GNAT family N-acetyltransferase [Spirochaetota bacterium]|nr:GNAT family N-acetyltransferase [Spirochaetota bacterium]
MEELEIIDASLDNVQNFSLCGYKNAKKEGYKEKLQWIKKNFDLGLRIKFLYSKEAGTQGMIEYMPSENSFRALKNVQNYYTIHCIFTGFKNEYKNKGYGSKLIESCFEDAKSNNKTGVVAVARDSSFMAGKEIFLKNGFEIVDKSAPDFYLMVKKTGFSEDFPKFYDDLNKVNEDYKEGLYIFRSDQCPYTVKNVNEIIDYAKNDLKINVKVVNIDESSLITENPSPFGTFGIIYNGKIVSYHPISLTRFKNIAKSFE